VDNASFGASLEVSAFGVEDRPEMLTYDFVRSPKLEGSHIQQTMQFRLLRHAMEEKGHKSRHHNGRVLVTSQTHLQLSSQFLPAQPRLHGRPEQGRFVEKITGTG